MSGIPGRSGNGSPGMHTLMGISCKSQYTVLHLFHKYVYTYISALDNTVKTKSTYHILMISFDILDLNTCREAHE